MTPPRNPWEFALWAAGVLGLAGVAGGGVALVLALPDRLREQEYANTDWAWVNVLEVLVIPACATLLFASTLALVAYYGVRWASGSRARRG
ncbi:hypothetical protein WDJ51_11470 [Rathayibacter sp. YIM 133350]|uniref:hypothetical protein n=1 Tax=Rathayibacter sp. YIM 133350 TaxID=3131992 RepID=UPI00307CD5A2